MESRMTFASGPPCWAIRDVDVGVGSIVTEVFGAGASIRRAAEVAKHRLHAWLLLVELPRKARPSAGNADANDMIAIGKVLTIITSNDFLVDLHSTVQSDTAASPLNVPAIQFHHYLL
jgi:hypothetical protein